MIRNGDLPRATMKSVLLTIIGGMVAVWATGAESKATPAKPTPREDLTEWFSRSNGVYSVYEAARAGDKETLQARLREGEPPNGCNELGDTPLHLAAQGGQVEIVTCLLEAGADPLATDAAGHIPSQTAANDACREACLKYEALRHKELELFPLVRSGQNDALKAALDAGANPNALSQDNSLSLLAEAVLAGSTESVRLLLTAGANPNYTRPDSKSLLHLAAAAGQVEAISLLLSAGADALARAGNGAMPIHDAIWAGRTQAAIALVPAYASVGYNPDGWGNGYPISMAIQRGNAEVVQALLQAGLDPNAPAFAAEPLTVQAARQNRAGILQMLLQAGADKTARDSAGKTAEDYLPGSTSGH